MPLNHRIAGPVNGLFLSVISLPVGEFGDSFIGQYRIFPWYPTDYFKAGALAEGACEAAAYTRSKALQGALQLGLSRVSSLPAGSNIPASTQDHLACIAYVSETRSKLSSAQLEHLISSSRIRNRQYGITGQLIYHDERFMQYIEGPSAHVELIYHYIWMSELHQGPIELMRSPISSRIFESWSLAFKISDRHRWNKIEKQPELISMDEHARTVEKFMQHFTQTVNAPPPDVVSSTIAARKS